MNTFPVLGSSGVACYDAGMLKNPPEQPPRRWSVTLALKPGVNSTREVVAGSSRAAVARAREQIAASALPGTLGKKALTAKVVSMRKIS